MECGTGIRFQIVGKIKSRGDEELNEPGGRTDPSSGAGGSCVMKR
jgi:hypothetical protein